MRRAGTEAAISHWPKPMLIPYCCATWIAMGFADVAVIHSADDTARLAMALNIRYPPNLRPLGSSGREPDPWATDSTMGYSTPPRAVLLGKAGAMAASVRMML